MKTTIEKRVGYIIGGLNAADNYLSEDLDAICDDTMREYAEETLDSLQKATSHASFLEKNLPLFLDALADISIYIGYRNIEFKDSKERSITLRSWAQEFVDKYADADWEKMDYIILVGEFAVEKVNTWVKDNPQTPAEPTYQVSYVLGTEAVREYTDCVDAGEKWNESSLCDCGSVAHGSFFTQAELDAYKQGIEDATGYLESEKMMTEKEWKEYLEDFFSDDEEE